MKAKTELRSKNIVKTFNSLQEAREFHSRLKYPGNGIIFNNSVQGLGKTTKAIQIANESNSALFITDRHQFIEEEIYPKLIGEVIYLRYPDRDPSLCNKHDEYKKLRRDIDLSLYNFLPAKKGHFPHWLVCEILCPKKRERTCEMHNIENKRSKAKTITTVYELMSDALRNFYPEKIILDENILKPRKIVKPNIGSIDLFKIKEALIMKLEEEFNRTGNTKYKKYIKGLENDKNILLDYLKRLSSITSLLEYALEEKHQRSIRNNMLLLTVELEKTKETSLLKDLIKYLVKNGYNYLAYDLIKFIGYCHGLKEYVLYKLIYWEENPDKIYRPYLYDILEHIINMGFMPSVIINSASVSTIEFEEHIRIFNREWLRKNAVLMDKKVNEIVNLIHTISRDKVTFIEIIARNPKTRVYHFHVKKEKELSYYPKETVDLEFIYNLIIGIEPLLRNRRVLLVSHKEIIEEIKSKRKEGREKIIPSDWQLLYYYASAGFNPDVDTVLAIGTPIPEEKAIYDEFYKIYKRTPNEKELGYGIGGYHTFKHPVLRFLQYNLREKVLLDTVERVRGLQGEKLIIIFGLIPKELKQRYTYIPVENPRMRWHKFFSALHRKLMERNKNLGNVSIAELNGIVGEIKREHEIKKRIAQSLGGQKGSREGKRIGGKTPSSKYIAKKLLENKKFKNKSLEFLKNLKNS